MVLVRASSAHRASPRASGRVSAVDDDDAQRGSAWANWNNAARQMGVARDGVVRRGGTTTAVWRSTAMFAGAGGRIAGGRVRRWGW